MHRASVSRCPCKEAGKFSSNNLTVTNYPPAPRATSHETGTGTIAALRKYAANKTIEDKILFENSMKLFRLVSQRFHISACPCHPVRPAFAAMARLFRCES